MTITAQLADPPGIAEQVELASRAHDTASATAHRTASATAKAHARADALRRLRDPRTGRWVHDKDAMEAAATGRRAGAIRVHDHILRADVDYNTGFSRPKVDLRPSEVISVRHHWEGTGKSRKRFTDIVSRHPDTGAEHEESFKDGASVRLFPREDVQAAARKPSAMEPAPPLKPAVPPRPPAPVPAKAAPGKTIAQQVSAPAPAPAPALKPALAPPAPPPAPAGVKPAPAGKTLEGADLWMSGEGRTPDVTDAEAAAARTVWYKDTFSYTNDYLRSGIKPSVNARNSIKEASPMGGLERAKKHLALPAKDDAEYIRGIGIYRKMVDRAPAFSRPALLHRDITSPDQVFGPVGSMKGRVFSDPGFMSATADPGTAENYGGYTGVPGKMVLHVPAGGGGMRSELRFSKDHVREKEYTFAPGTKWRVDDDRVVGGVRQTTVTQILPDGARPGPKPEPVKPAIQSGMAWEQFPGARYDSETGEYQGGF